MPDQSPPQAPTTGWIISPTPPSKAPSVSSDEHPETGRSKRKSPIAMELLQSIGDEESRASSFDIFREDENSDPMLMANFVPKLGYFGAPACRWTSSVMSLLGICAGMVIAVSGICILFFFVEEEPTIIPLGFTLLVVGTLMLFLGTIMWTSEFMCDDCLGRCHQKLKEAPMKNAIKRRSRMASRATTMVTAAARGGSRLSASQSEVSLRSNGTSKTTVSTKY